MTLEPSGCQKPGGAPDLANTSNSKQHLTNWHCLAVLQCQNGLQKTRSIHAAKLSRPATSKEAETVLLELVFM